MASSTLEYPQQRLLWPGAMLGSIAHAVTVARYPDLAHEQSWDGSNYCVQDSAGSRGVVAFSGNQFVAVFFSEDSARNPFRSKELYDLHRFLVGLPDELASLAHDEALQYVLQDYEGRALPIITAAFWGDGKQERVVAAEEWSGVFENGAFLIKNQMLNESESLAAWQAEYELSAEETALVTSVYERRLAHPDKQFQLSAAENSLLQSIAEGEEGIEVSRESFSEISIVL